MLASSRSQGLSLTVLVHYRCLKVIRPGARFKFDGVPSHHNPQGDGGPLASLPASRTGLSPSCRRRVPARPSPPSPPSGPKEAKAGGDLSDSRRSRRGLAAPRGERLATKVLPRAWGPPVEGPPGGGGARGPQVPRPGEGLGAGRALEGGVIGGPFQGARRPRPRGGRVRAPPGAGFLRGGGGKGPALMASRGGGPLGRALGDDP